MPKNYNAAPILEDTCCNASSTQHCDGEYSKDEKPCHSDDKKKESKDCHDCHSCVSIGLFADLQKNSLKEESLEMLHFSKKISTYLTPEFLDFTSKIWQPPKII